MNADPGKHIRTKGAVGSAGHPRGRDSRLGVIRTARPLIEALRAAPVGTRDR